MLPDKFPGNLHFARGMGEAAGCRNRARDIKLPLALLLLLVLVIAGGGYLAFDRIQESETQMMQQNLAAIANLKANEINRWIAQNKTNAIITSRGSPVADRTRQWLDRGMLPGADLDWLRSRLEGLRKIHSYGEMAVLDIYGKPLISSEQALPEVAELQPLLQRALAAGEPVVGDMRWNRQRRGYPYIAVPFAAPLIASGPEGRIVGILLIHADANQFLFPLIQAWPTPSETAETFIARQEDGDLLILNELRHQPGSALVLRFPVGHPDRLAAKIFRGEQGLLHGVDYRGESVIGYGTWIPGTDWLMVAKIDERELYAPIRRMAIAVAATAFVLLLVSSLALYLWWRQRNDQFRAEQLQAELERQLIAHQYETLSKYANDIILLIGLDYKILEANDRAEQALGLSRSELIGKSLLDIARPGDREHIERYWAQIRQSKSMIFDHTALVRSDGTAFHIETSARLIEEGNAGYVHCVIRDISERKRFQEELQRREQEYRSLVEGLPKTNIARYDGQCRFIFASPGIGEKIGLPMEEILGRKPTQVDKDSEFASVMEKAIERVLSTGEQTVFQSAYRTAKGLSHREFTLTPESIEDGRVKTVLQTSYDITDLKELEEALRHEEARFRQLADAMPQLIWMATADGRVDYYNDRYHEYSGFSRKETGEFEWAPVVHPEDREATVRAWEHAIRTGEMYQIEHRVERADGAYHWHISRALPVRDDGGAVVRWYGTATDIHDLKLAQEAAQRNEERLRLAQQAARMGSFEWHIRTGVNDWSHELEALYGLQPGEFERTYDAWKNRVLPDDRDEADRLTREGVDAGSFEAEWRVPLPDGSIRWIAGRGQLFRDGNGRPERMVGINMDITARRQAEEERARLLHQLEAVLENLAEGVIIFDGKGNVTSMNGTALRMHGFSDMEQARRHLAEFEHEFALFDGGGQPLPLQDWPLARVLNGERFADLEVQVVQRKTGVKRIYSYSGSPVVDPAKKLYLGVLTLRDITERKRVEEELRLAALVYQESAEAMMVTDGANRIVAINPAFERLTGYKAEEIIGKSPLILSSGRGNRANYREMLNKLMAGNYWQGELWLSKKSGEIFAAGMTINTTFNPDGSVSRHVSLFSDITERKQAEEAVWQQANFDPLTNLPNRRHFLDQLNQEIRKSRRSRLPFALMFMDLDGFKSVNDTLGHEAGDLLLKEAAERLKQCVRETDMVARLGGDEFIIILSELRTTRHAEKVARHILHKLSEPFVIGGEITHVSGSVGITFYPQDASNADDLLINADNAMYSAKESGKNRYGFFTEAMQKAAQERMWLVSELRSAIDGRQFRLVYQPIIELQSGCVNKAEALLRWHHPERGEIDPSVFIPVAEDTGMIQEIGNWVFFEAASQVARWRKEFHPDFQVSINKSPVQFKSRGDDLASWLDYLRVLDLPGQSIAVEITEGVLMDESKAVTDQLLAFRDAGIEVALDDFGTGYSTLSYLKRFDIDRLKIDQTFIRDLETDANDQALCEAMIVMGHKLGIKVIAEGVETDRQREILANAGCDFVQGYLVSTPVPAEALNDLLRTGSIQCFATPPSASGYH